MLFSSDLILDLESIRLGLNICFNGYSILLNKLIFQVPGSIDFPYRLDQNRPDEEADDASSRMSEVSRASHVSSSFKFIGDYSDPVEVIKRTPDFDSVILLLHEVYIYFPITYLSHIHLHPGMCLHYRLCTTD